MPLTALKIKYAKPGRHADIHGLYLYVRKRGSKSWVLRMQFKSRRRDFGLGPLHDISLAEARCLASEIRKMVRAGLDPVKERGLVRDSKPTFETTTRRCYEAMKGGWKDRRHASWLSSFENHVFPTIGGLRIDAIDTHAVLEVLEPIWTEIPDTARRILQRIGAVLDYAHVKGLVPEEISLRSVRRGLPRQQASVKHHAAMPYDQVPAFMKKLVAQPSSTGRDAMRFTMLTAVRSNETRFAIWGEFDLEKGVWSIPAARMKAKLPHVVPLSPAVIAFLQRIKDGDPLVDDGQDRKALTTPDKLVFSKDGKKVLSDATMTKALRELGETEATVHGFRSSFTDWSSEQTDFPKEIADKALAHLVPNAVEAAYRRTDFFDKRRTLMEMWADYVLSKSADSKAVQCPPVLKDAAANSQFFVDTPGT